MEIQLEENVYNNSKFEENKEDVINIFYRIIMKPKPFVVFYLKISNTNNDIIDFSTEKEDMYEIHNFFTIEDRGFFEYENNEYKLTRVFTNEKDYMKHGIYIVCAYEILNLKTVFNKNISDKVISNICDNDFLYILYDNNYDILLNPWVLYLPIEREYYNFVYYYGYLKTFSDDTPYMKLYYKPEMIDNKKYVARIIVFMENIVLRNDTVSSYDIRDNNVYISKYENNLFFGVQLFL